MKVNMDFNNPSRRAVGMTYSTFALGLSVIRPVSVGPMSLTK
jgi:hypothetical protein